MSNKSPKNELQGNMIDNLPDCIICHILSCLPMKDAVRTSVLSKDWEYKWTRMHTFILCDGSSWLTQPSTISPNFVKAVERTLLLPDLQSFHLSCFGEYDLLRWMTAALNRNVSYLYLWCRGSRRFILPRNLLTCYSLRTLRLNIQGCTFNVPEKVCFPNLTTLELANVCISKEHSDSDRVEFDCPLLETLQLWQCKWLNMKFVEIYAPKMTILELFNAVYVSAGCSLKINGNSLEKLICVWFGRSDSNLNNIALSGVANVVYASLQHCVRRDDVLLEKSGLELQKLLKGFSSLRDLEVRGNVEEVIAKLKLGISLPKYYKMERLLLSHLNYVRALLELLHAMPYLKLLVIAVKDLEEYDFDALESVPSCIASHLEKVKITSFTGKPSEINLIKFFLKKASELKSLLVQLSREHPPEKERYVVAEELSTYPKASTCLNLTVEERGEDIVF